MNFPPRFTDWIMTCIHTCIISVKINGSLEGFFKAGSGLRQGDPLSPYLFVLAIEVLSAFLKRSSETDTFKFHLHTKSLSITHLIFADDIMLFSHGDKASIDLLLKGVNDFSSVLGLYTNHEKSLCFFANVDVSTRDYVLASSGFQQGTFPVKYLGLPLITTKLSFRDCNPLLMRLSGKIDCWVNKVLNHAGRLPTSP